MTTPSARPAANRPRRALPRAPERGARARVGGRRAARPAARRADRRRRPAGVGPGSPSAPARRLLGGEARARPAGGRHPPPAPTPSPPPAPATTSGLRERLLDALAEPDPPASFEEGARPPAGFADVAGATEPLILEAVGRLRGGDAVRALLGDLDQPLAATAALATGAHPDSHRRLPALAHRRPLDRAAGLDAHPARPRRDAAHPAGPPAHRPRGVPSARLVPRAGARRPRPSRRATSEAPAGPSWRPRCPRPTAPRRRPRATLPRPKAPPSRPSRPTRPPTRSPLPRPLPPNSILRRSPAAVRSSRSTSRSRSRTTSRCWGWSPAAPTPRCVGRTSPWPSSSTLTPTATNGSPTCTTCSRRCSSASPRRGRCWATRRAAPRTRPVSSSSVVARGRRPAPRRARSSRLDDYALRAARGDPAQGAAPPGPGALLGRHPDARDHDPPDGAAAAPAPRPDPARASLREEPQLAAQGGGAAPGRRPGGPRQRRRALRARAALQVRRLSPPAPRRCSGARSSCAPTTAKPRPSSALAQARGGGGLLKRLFGRGKAS